MADKYINKTGLSYFYNRIKTLFAKQADLTALDTKVDGIIAEGGEPNVIETVKVNGTALTPDAQKAVDISIPTVSKSGTGETEKVSVVDGQNTYDVPTVDAMEDYVSEHGGVIQKVKYDGTELSIDTTDKSVNVPKEAFIATLNVTSYTELKNAFDSQKVIYINGSASGAQNIFIPTTAQIDENQNIVIRSIRQRTSAEVQVSQWVCTPQSQWTYTTLGNLAMTTDVEDVVFMYDTGQTEYADLKAAYLADKFIWIKGTQSDGNYHFTPTTIVYDETNDVITLRTIRQRTSGELQVIEWVNDSSGRSNTKLGQVAMITDIPTNVSDLTNDGDGTTGSKFATESYVDTNGGKIDVIKVNGTVQTITNKEVDLTVPTKTSDITNDSGYQTASDVSTYVTGLKGQADGVASLDSSGLVPTSQLPSYVDDVIEAYPISGATELSAGWLSLTSGGSALTPETGKIYVLMAASESYDVNSVFRWSGSTYVKIADSNLSAITTAEIDEIIDDTQG